MHIHPKRHGSDNTASDLRLGASTVKVAEALACAVEGCISHLNAVAVVQGGSAQASAVHSQPSTFCRASLLLLELEGVARRRSAMRAAWMKKEGGKSRGEASARRR